jgi:alkylhydroperoxidase family enzyme
VGQIRELTVSASWRDLGASLWTPTERLIVRMVDELHHHSTVSDDAWRQMSARWPREQVMELLFASSFYHMAAFFLNSAAVPLEVGAERFPDGVAQACVPS